MKKIIFNDLRELKKRLASLPYIVYPKYGKLDSKTFEWLKINSGIDFSEGLEQLSKNGVGTEEILTYINTKGLQENKASNFKRMHLFATDSHLMNLGLIDNGLIEKILEIRFHIEAFNEEVESFRDCLKMTFLPGITADNHKIISEEIKNKSLLIAKKSIFIVDKINNVLISEDAPESSK